MIAVTEPPAGPPQHDSQRNAGANRARQRAVIAPLLVFVPLGLWWSVSVPGGSPGDEVGSHEAPVRIAATGAYVEQATVRVDPNQASVAMLATLPRIGDVLAQRIVDYREAHAHDGSAFRHLADLDAVRGVGPKTLALIEPYLRFPDLGGAGIDSESR